MRRAGERELIVIDETTGHSAEDTDYLDPAAGRRAALTGSASHPPEYRAAVLTVPLPVRAGAKDERVSSGAACLGEPSEHVHALLLEEVQEIDVDPVLGELVSLPPIQVDNAHVGSLVRRR